jgi:hypothetical protein
VKAHEWYERGKQAADPIDSLANFWRGFNNLYSSTSKGKERKRIKLFLRNSVTKAEAERLLVAEAASVDVLLSRPVNDMRGNGSDTAPNIGAFNVATDSIVKLQELFMVVYQVRCNLEHGQKSPSRDRDMRLCEAAALIVAAVLDLTQDVGLNRAAR